MVGETDVFEQFCMKCGRKNKVFVIKRDGFGEKEEYFCAYCGFEMGAVDARESPTTVIQDADATLIPTVH